jgi:hypothetical protein
MWHALWLCVTHFFCLAVPSGACYLRWERAACCSSQANLSPISHAQTRTWAHDAFMLIGRWYIVRSAAAGWVPVLSCLCLGHVLQNMNICVVMADGAAMPMLLPG